MLHLILQIHAIPARITSQVSKINNDGLKSTEDVSVFITEDEIAEFITKKEKSLSKSSDSNDRYQGKSVKMEDFTQMLPKLNFHFDPVINFKLKQKITKFGASITLGMDYLSDLRQWRARCDVEDTIVRDYLYVDVYINMSEHISKWLRALVGRFSLRGSELGWAKSWLWNLGLGAENSAKFKLRVGLNLKNYKAYMRLRFRTESISPFDIGDGLTCAGKLGIPGLLHVMGSKPLRLEYLLRIRTPQPAFAIKRNDRDGLISLSTGIDKIDVSLDELNFCLEWDEDSPLWDIGLVRDMNRSWRARQANRFASKVPSPPTPTRRPVTPPPPPPVSPKKVPPSGSSGAGGSSRNSNNGGGSSSGGWPRGMERRPLPSSAMSYN